MFNRTVHGGRTSGRNSATPAERGGQGESGVVSSPTQPFPNGYPAAALAGGGEGTAPGDSMMHALNSQIISGGNSTRHGTRILSTQAAPPPQRPPPAPLNDMSDIYQMEMRRRYEERENMSLSGVLQGFSLEVRLLSLSDIHFSTMSRLINAIHPYVCVRLCGRSFRSGPYLYEPKKKVQEDEYNIVFLKETALFQSLELQQRENRMFVEVWDSGLFTDTCIGINWVCLESLGLRANTTARLQIPVHIKNYSALVVLELTPRFISTPLAVIDPRTGRLSNPHAHGPDGVSEGRVVRPDMLNDGEIRGAVGVSGHVSTGVTLLDRMMETVQNIVAPPPALPANNVYGSGTGNGNVPYLNFANSGYTLTQPRGFASTNGEDSDRPLPDQLRHGSDFADAQNPSQIQQRQLQQQPPLQQQPGHARQSSGNPSYASLPSAMDQRSNPYGSGQYISNAAHRIEPTAVIHERHTPSLAIGNTSNDNGNSRDDIHSDTHETDGNGGNVSSGAVLPDGVYCGVPLSVVRRGGNGAGESRVNMSRFNQRGEEEEEEAEVVGREVSNAEEVQEERIPNPQRTANEANQLHVDPFTLITSNNNDAVGGDDDDDDDHVSVQATAPPPDDDDDEDEEEGCEEKPAEFEQQRDQQEVETSAEVEVETKNDTQNHVAESHRVEAEEEIIDDYHHVEEDPNIRLSQIPFRRIDESMLKDFEAVDDSIFRESRRRQAR